MDRAKVRAISSDMIEALAAVGRKHGVQFSYGGGRFTASNAKLKVEVSEIGAGGEVQTPEVEAFKKHAESYGFEQSDLGRTFRIGRSTYRITGLAPRRRRYPVSASRTGKNPRPFKFTAQQVLDALGKGTATGLTDDIKRRFVDLACQLSPENLTCDGELGASAVRARRQEIEREWAQLEAQAGRTVTESEAWAFEGI